MAPHSAHNSQPARQPKVSASSAGQTGHVKSGSNGSMASWQKRLAHRAGQFKGNGVYPMALIVKNGRRFLVVNGDLEDLGT